MLPRGYISITVSLTLSEIISFNTIKSVSLGICYYRVTYAFIEHEKYPAQNQVMYLYFCAQVGFFFFFRIIEDVPCI